jgi:membrane fusion protein, heavy metal efflux system
MARLPRLKRQPRHRVLRCAGRPWISWWCAIPPTTLLLYLDDTLTNRPLVDAKIDLQVNGQSVPWTTDATQTHMAVLPPELAASTSLEVVVSLVTPTLQDLLSGVLVSSGQPAQSSLTATPQKTTAAVEAPTVTPTVTPVAPAFIASPSATFQNDLTFSKPVIGVIGGLMLVVFLSGFMMSTVLSNRSRLAVLCVAVLLLMVCASLAAYAHSGHDHGTPAPEAPTGDAPRWSSDGTLYVPKSTQRLLDIRTQALRRTTKLGTLTLSGRVIADPAKSAFVHSLMGGRVEATEDALPQMGMMVKAGQPLARVQPSLSPLELATTEQREMELNRDIMVQTMRPRADITEQIAFQSLLAQRRRLREARNFEVLTAPIEGVIAQTSVTIGQVVQPQERLFHILDPNALWIEAVAMTPVDFSEQTDAVAQTLNGSKMSLRYRGTARSLENQAHIVHFAVQPRRESVNGEIVVQSVNLPLGTPVMVYVKTPESALTGLIIPRDAVVRTPSGESVVFEHIAPEQFAARPVRTEAMDGDTVLVRDGLIDGARLVVQGATWLNQIR